MFSANTATDTLYSLFTLPLTFCSLLTTRDITGQTELPLTYSALSSRDIDTLDVLSVQIATDALCSPPTTRDNTCLTTTDAFCSLLTQGTTLVRPTAIDTLCFPPTTRDNTVQT